MAEKIGELVVEMRAETKQIRTELTNMKKQFGGVEKNVKSTTTSISNFAAGIGITAGIGTALYAVQNFGKEALMLGQQMEGLQNSFQNMAGQAAPELLRAIQKASAGTVSEIDAIAAANKAMVLGIDKESLPQMMEIARAASQTMGTDVTTAFNDIATGMGRQSKLILDNLGIIVDAEKAYARYAQEVGKTSAQLTDLEKKQAFNNETIRIGTNNMEAMGGAMDTSKESVQRFTAAWKDFKVDVGEELSQTLGKIATDFDVIKTAVDNSDTSFSKFVSTSEKVSKHLTIYGGISIGLKKAWDKFIDTLEESNNTLEAQRWEIEQLTTAGFEWKQSLQEFAQEEEIAINTARDLGLVTEEYRSHMFGLRDELDRGIITAEEYVLREKEINEQYKDQLPLIKKAITAQDSLTESVSDTTVELKELQATFKRGFGVTSMGKGFEEVRSEILSGKAEADVGVRKLFNIPEMQTGGPVEQTGLHLLHKGEHVVPAGKANNMRRSVVVNIGTISGVDETAIAEALQDALDRKITW